MKSTPPEEEGIHDLQMNVERGRGLVIPNFKLLKLADNILKKKDREEGDLNGAHLLLWPRLES